MSEDRMSTTLSKFIFTFTFIGVAIELLLYPSADNLCGCLMTVLSAAIFVWFGLNCDFVRDNPFSFVAYLTMFLYRFLPLFSTLIEGKEISYGMESAIKTFLLESILFIIATIAYVESNRIKFSIGKDKPALLKGIFDAIGLFNQPSSAALWILGILGLSSKLVMLSMGAFSELGVLYKILSPFNVFSYAPVMLFFPGLLNMKCEKRINFRNKGVWLYIVILSILNLGSNSRSAIIAPFAIIMLMILLECFFGTINVNEIFQPKRMVLMILVIVIAYNTLNVVSNAILITRSVRGDVSFTELIRLSVNSIVTSTKDGEETDEISIKSKDEVPTSYASGWTEDYIDNFILNRFANIRITDEVFYYSDKLHGDSKGLLQEDLLINVICRVIPQPLINILGIKIDKSDYEYSRGDYIYYASGVGNVYSLGGYRVTSHLADGMATFGILYFPIQVIVWFFIFKLLNTLTLWTSEGIIYSSFGMINLYTFLRLFTNTYGIASDFQFLFRGFWQSALFYACAMLIARIIGNSSVRL